MSIIEATLIFAGIPALIIVLIVAGVYAGGARRAKRYRPGRPFEFTPVWFVAAPELLGDGGDARALTGPTRAALPAGEARATQSSERSTGGASDRW